MMGARSPDTKIEAPLVQPTFKESRQTPHWVRFDYCPLLHILSADHQFDLRSIVECETTFCVFHIS